MIEGAEQQDGVDAPIGPSEPSGVAEPGAGETLLGMLLPHAGGFFDVERDGIDEVDGVALRCQPVGVDAQYGLAKPANAGIGDAGADRIVLGGVAAAPLRRAFGRVAKPYWASSPPQRLARPGVLVPGATQASRRCGSP